MNNMTTEDKVSYAVTEIVESLKMARAGLRYILMVDETADVEKIAFLFSQCTDALLEMEHISYSGEYDNGLVTRDYFEKIVQDKFADWEQTKKKADEDWLNFLKENDHEAYTRRMKIVAMRDECDKMRERVSKANKEELPGLLCEYREMLNKTRKYIDGETMQRLIDANALKLSHCKECTLYPDKCMGKDCDMGAIIHINAMPTIDAVPVIRCKDCKWWREDSDHTCKHFYTSPRVANDFCSYAEPKEEKR